ncbi:MAG TPA: helix-turn-helix domain-containing protein [Candidatus Dormibacteraeota bacterium]|nr:helix-turn-helix domain-containing protein [Candidatus Dormibacteraeota bacterium]
MRCVGCGVTQALLPWFVLPWRWDEVKWIGKAVELAAGGMGQRRIATALGRSENTVRAWLRRVRRTAAELSRELLARATS